MADAADLGEAGQAFDRMHGVAVRVLDVAHVSIGQLQVEHGLVAHAVAGAGVEVFGEGGIGQVNILPGVERLQWRIGRTRRTRVFSAEMQLGHLDEGETQSGAQIRRDRVG